MSFKQQLRDEILPRTVEYYNSGIGIDESIVKAASDFKLNVDQTDRLVETMNTARTIAHYEKNASDRTANFDIADKNRVHRLLFEDSSEKRASAASDEAGLFDYSFYDGAERDFRHARSDGSEITKAAEAVAHSDGVGAFSERRTVEEVVKYADKMEELRKFASSRAEAAETYLFDGYGKIAKKLSSGYDPDLRYATFKTAASSLGLKDVVEGVERCMNPQIVKDASSRFKELRRANILDTSSISDELRMAKAAAEDVVLVGKMKAAADGFAKKEDRARRKIAEYQAASEGQMDFFGVKTAATSGGGKGGSEKKKKKEEKSDPWFGKTVDKMIPKASPGVKNMFDYMQGAALDAKKIDELLNPPKPKSTELKEYVNNMRRSDIITELYEEDPILSEADPNEVSRAYATLVQTSPEASLNKEVVRAILRQSVNSVAVSPFDAKQWAELDKTMLENEKLKAQIAGRVRL